ncbi:MAG: sensor histidine kinase [Ornithinimicrobium sp.]|uniref:sensor histidine kinase n=1 Tax=Ornithinimicrobium sp. TaxID=1977084 RepID=UPI003D9B1EB2
MIPEVSAVALAAGTAGVVGALGAWGTVLLARRSVASAILVSPVVVVASIAGGVLVSARAMFLSDDDVAIVALLLAASVPVALACGLLGYRAVRRIDQQAAAAQAQGDRQAALAASRREMVTWASHDLKSPLAGIRVMAEALEDGLVADPTDYHRRIRRESDRMTRMVDDLLEMSALQQGGSGGAREQVDLAELTRDIVQGQVPVAERAGVRLRVEAEEPVPLVVDAGRIERAVANIVRNAILYTRAEGEVRVAVRAEGTGAGRGTAYLQVDDTCGGLRGDDLERVFEPGWRGSAPRTPGAVAGAGVGMTIARAIAEDHDGGVDLANHGDGCRVTLRLPVRPAR